MSYVRIQVRYCGRTGKPVGIFCACHHLRRRGVLPAEDDALFQQVEDWFIEHLPQPAFYQDGNPDKAITWFKAEAVDMLERLGPLRTLLDKHGVRYDIVRTDDPGRIIYEDPWQVAVVGDNEELLAMCEPILIDPAVELDEEYRAFIAEFDDGPGMGGGRRIKDDETFAQFVRRLMDGAAGIGIPDDHVPCNVYWLVRGNRVLGNCSLRHRLTERLRDYGGHIGYSVRPSERRKGYGTLMLRLALAKARQRGIARVLVTCDKDNIASARVIQANGGVLDSEGVDPHDGKPTQRYWIENAP